MTINICWKIVDFRAEQIDDIYGIPNADMGVFEEKGCEPRSWLAKTLFPIKKVSWAAMM